MAFIQAIIKNPTRSLSMLNKSTSQATTQNQVLVLTAGLAVPASSAATVLTIAGVCNQSITAGEALSQVPIIELSENDVWIADCTNNSDPLDNGQFMVLTDSVTVNNTGTTDPNGVVQQVGVYGAAADKKILVRFRSN